MKVFYLRTTSAIRLYVSRRAPRLSRANIQNEQAYLAMKLPGQTIRLNMMVPVYRKYLPRQVIGQRALVKRIYLIDISLLGSMIL